MKHQWFRRLIQSIGHRNTSSFHDHLGFWIELIKQIDHKIKLNRLNTQYPDPDFTAFQSAYRALYALKAALRAESVNTIHNIRLLEANNTITMQLTLKSRITYRQRPKQYRHDVYLPQGLFLPLVFLDCMTAPQISAMALIDWLLHAQVNFCQPHVQYEHRFAESLKRRPHFYQTIASHFVAIGIISKTSTYNEPHTQLTAEYLSLVLTGSPDCVLLADQNEDSLFTEWPQAATHLNHQDWQIIQAYHAAFKPFNKQRNTGHDDSHQVDCSELSALPLVLHKYLSWRINVCHSVINDHHLSTSIDPYQQVVYCLQQQGLLPYKQVISKVIAVDFDGTLANLTQFFTRLRTCFELCQPSQVAQKLHNFFRSSSEVREAAEDILLPFVTAMKERRQQINALNFLYFYFQKPGEQLFIFPLTQRHPSTGNLNQYHLGNDTFKFLITLAPKELLAVYLNRIINKAGFLVTLRKAFFPSCNTMYVIDDWEPGIKHPEIDVHCLPINHAVVGESQVLSLFPVLERLFKPRKQNTANTLFNSPRSHPAALPQIGGQHIYKQGT